MPVDEGHSHSQSGFLSQFRKTDPFWNMPGYAEVVVVVVVVVVVSL